MSKNRQKELLEEITPENCGQKLDIICQAAGISLTKLADLLDEKPATLSHIKSGRRRPSQKFMNRLRALALIRPKGYERQDEEFEPLSVAAVVAGLNTLARTSLLKKAAFLASGARLGLAIAWPLPFGVLYAVDAICKKLGLSYKETEDELEITTDSNERHQEPLEKGESDD